MSIGTVNELIQMYSSGVISRESLEREMNHWTPSDQHDGHADEAENGECLVLYPDSHGIWRVNA